MEQRRQGTSWVLMIAALGVVCGDIATSPLYTIAECFALSHGMSADPAAVRGVLSLIFWALTLVVTVKYVLILTRFDNDGEGGILALLALIPQKAPKRLKEIFALSTVVALAGAAFLYGDALITPAISVLGAVEGLAVARQEYQVYVVPVTVAILLALFSAQRTGTGRLGGLFGPIMMLWFLTIGILGLHHIARSPEILSALWPTAAIQFIVEQPKSAFHALGGVVLAVTGGEALYADMGHFGRRPIARAWYYMAYPCLVLNYFGQGANLLANPAAIRNPFYALVEGTYLLYPLTALATTATIVAAQGILTGIFSLTYQAMQLGYLPRFRLVHTDREIEGRIYIPFANWALAIGCIWLVVEFRASAALASAYGLAVSSTMFITSLLLGFVLFQSRHVRLAIVIPVVLAFAAIDLPFLFSNALKFFEGGWLSVTVGCLVLLTMLSWRSGRYLLGKHYARNSESLDTLLAAVRAGGVNRTPGSAAFLVTLANVAPAVLSTMVRKFRSLPELAFLVTVVIDSKSHVRVDDRYQLTELGEGLYRLVIRYGYMQMPNVPLVLEQAARENGLGEKLAETQYFLGNESLAVAHYVGLKRWFAEFFAFLSRNARSPSEYFRLPSGRVYLLGRQVDIFDDPVSSVPDATPAGAVTPPPVVPPPSPLGGDRKG
jgi:KUP system potassium uptake protein